jgi:hypothetical protein
MEKETNEVVVLARSGHGQDFKEMYHVNKKQEADFRKDPANKDKALPALTLKEAKEDAVKYIREHRAGSAGMDYRMKDLVTGAILD